MTAKLPEAAQRTADDFPEIWAAYQALGKATEAAGPLDAKTIRLVKLGIAIGASFDLSLIHISEPTRPPLLSRMPSSA